MVPYRKIRSVPTYMHLPLLSRTNSGLLLPMDGCTNHFSFSIQNGYKEKGFRRVQENQLVKTMSNIY